MKIAENRSERKESTKESQGDISFGMMGFCRETMTISKDYEKTMTIMEDNGRLSMT
jgi:hypothetical protein